MKHIFSKQNRALLSELVRTDFKLRYQGSVLGYVWSLLRPLLIFLILYVIFVQVVRVNYKVPHSGVYLLLGIVMWNFFNEMTVQSLGSIVGRGDLIRKIKIPRWIIVLSSSLSALINLGLNLLVVAVFMVINHVDLMKTALLLPIILLNVYLFALGISLFLSAAYVKYRDVSYIWEVCIQAGFYITPVIYPLWQITNPSLQKFILLNPLAMSVQDARYALITHNPNVITIDQVFNGGVYQYAPYLITAVILAGSLWFFRRESKYFAENI